MMNDVGRHGVKVNQSAESDIRMLGSHDANE